MLKKLRDLRSDQSGIVYILIAVGLLMICGFAALVVDLGHVKIVQNQLKRVADAGALAGARGLWPDTLPLVSTTATPDCATALTRAQNIIANTSNGVDQSTINSQSVQVGQWDFKAKTFSAGCSSSANAVQVTVSKTGITTFIAQALGQTVPDQTQTSVAVMTYIGAVGKGTLPIAINKRYVVAGQTLFINFTPDPLDDAGWFSDPPDSASAITFRSYINGASCPPLHVGDIITLQNGQDTSVLQDLQDQLSAHNADNAPYDTYLPVVNTDQFNQSQPIIAFVPFRITQVTDNGNTKGVTGTVLGTAAASNGEPGGASSGPLSYPKLVN